MIDLNAPITEESVKELRQKWVEALRSGKYKQGYVRLRTADNKHCCLGVLCEVMELPRIDGPLFGPGYRLDSSPVQYTRVLTYGLSRFVGLDTLGHAIHEDLLLKKNDNRVPFEEIADYTETLPIILEGSVNTDKP